MGFQHPQQHAHMMKGIKAAMKSPRTPAHLKPHLASRAVTGNSPLSTTGPDDDELMEQAGRTPEYDQDLSEQDVSPTEEQVGQSDIMPNAKRGVVSSRPLSLGSPKPVLTNAVDKGKKKPAAKPSAFFGDFGGRPKHLKG